MPGFSFPTMLYTWCPYDNGYGGSLGPHFPAYQSMAICVTPQDYYQPSTPRQALYWGMMLCTRHSVPPIALIWPPVLWSTKTSKSPSRVHSLFALFPRYLAFTQGDSWISRVPELSLWLHALVSDPGGVLNTSLVRYMGLIAAFNRIQDCCLPLHQERRLSPD